MRGRRPHGGTWGEAILREFEETSGSWDAVRWAASGLRVAWRERRAGRPDSRAAARPLSVRARLLRWVLLPGAVGIVAALVVNSWVATVSYVPSGAMRPTFREGDRLLVDKVSFRLDSLHHNDVVLVSTRRIPNFVVPDTTVVKRIVGMPGDTISCQDGYFYRNGSRVSEPYLPFDTQNACTPVTVAPGRLYLVGDNVNNSSDSRIFGTVAESAVVARVVTRLWNG